MPEVDLEQVPFLDWHCEGGNEQWEGQVLNLPLLKIKIILGKKGVESEGFFPYSTLLSARSTRGYFQTMIL